jgi:hypothetical protein
MPLGPPVLTGEIPALELAPRAIARLVEPCFDGDVLPTEATVSAGVAADGTLSDVAIGPSTDARLACVRAALAPVRFAARPDATADAPATLRVRLHVVSAFEPRPDFAFPDDARTLCHDDADCVLVTGGCFAPSSVHVDYAEAIDREHRRILAAADCAGDAPPATGHAVCDGHVCRVEDDEHPEWRGCRGDHDCVPIARSCMRWEAVARAHEAEARAGLGDVAPTCDPPPDDEPHVACRYQACVAGWYGAD